MKKDTCKKKKKKKNYLLPNSGKSGRRKISKVSAISTTAKNVTCMLLSPYSKNIAKYIYYRAKSSEAST